MSDTIKEWIQEDGSLYDPDRYIAWKVGDLEVELDGAFSLDELRVIIGDLIETFDQASRVLGKATIE